MTEPSTRARERRIVVMGVAGSGKTTVGSELAAALGVEFVDGDSLHPPANVAKMRSGAALDDLDRWPWLDAIAEQLRRPSGSVVACSALKRSHRDVLRRAADVRFVHLALDRTTAEARATLRTGHFLGPTLVSSQFDALEDPSGEADVSIVDATMRLDEVVHRALLSISSPPTMR